jgi:hypothetical protein
VSFPVPRCGKRVALIACLARDGSFDGLKAFIDTTLFDAWFVGTFFPELHQRRQTTDFNGSAVSILGAIAPCSLVKHSRLSLGLESRRPIFSPTTDFPSPTRARLVAVRNSEMFTLPGKSNGSAQRAVQSYRRHRLLVHGRHHSSERGSDISQGWNHGG